MIPLAVPNLSGNEAKYLQECIDTTFVSSVGPFVDKLESMIAKTTGAFDVVCTASGTAGLHLALKAIGVQTDDLVIVPSFTFIASANAIDYCGATPWLMDIEEDSWCLDPNSLLTNLEKFTENKKGECIHSDTGRRVAAIMPVHTLGHPADMDEIVQIGQNYEIPVIADAAAALGAKYKSEPMGTLGAELAVFSFNGNKTITSGGGGAICSDNDSLLKHIKHLSTTARSSDKYDHDEVGFNYRITNIEAAVGCAQMERICEFIRIKRMIRDSYNEALGNVNGVSLFPEAEWAESAAWFSGIVIESDNYGTMDMIRTMLRENNIDARPFWKPVHLQVPYKHSIKEDLSVTESIWDRVLTLPCSTGLTKDEQDYVISAVLKILKR